MGVRYPSVSVITNVGVLASNGAETIIMTTPPLTIPLDAAQVFLYWYFLGNDGNGTTSLNVRIRRGAALTSPLINTGNIFNTVSNTVVALSGCYADTPGAVAGQQYSFTLQGGATIGVGSFLEGCLMAFAL